MLRPRWRLNIKIKKTLRQHPPDRDEPLPVVLFGKAVDRHADGGAGVNKHVVGNVDSNVGDATSRRVEKDQIARLRIPKADCFANRGLACGVPRKLLRKFLGKFLGKGGEQSANKAGAINPAAGGSGVAVGGANPRFSFLQQQSAFLWKVWLGVGSAQCFPLGCGCARATFGHHGSLHTGCWAAAKQERAAKKRREQKAGCAFCG